jgi:L-lysine 2,3-aminomutase
MKNSATIIPVSNSDCQVNSWKSQLKTAFSCAESLLQYLQIPAEEYHQLIDNNPNFAVRVPIAFANKMSKGDINDPLLLQALSVQQENIEISGYTDDPLQEQQDHRPGLLHKYHGRVLLLLTGSCAINCRYCFRRHFPYQTSRKELNNLESNLNYIARHSQIKEVILSGGDPLLISDSQLAELIQKLEEIEHVKYLRIHTRLPVVIPDRVTANLVHLLANTKLTTSLVIHSNHPNEIDQLTGRKLQQLVQSGTAVFNQSVLLKNVNDSPETLQLLSERLFQYQVTPYYLHLLDPVKGAAHFDLSKQFASKLMRQMRSRMPGYLVPRLVREEPNQPSKTLILS